MTATEPQEETPVRPGVLAAIAPVPFAVLALVIVFILYQLVGGLITFFVMGAAVTEANTATARWLTVGGQLVLILVPTVLLGVARKRNGTLFPVRSITVSQLLVTLLGVFSLQQVLQGYMVLQERIPLPDSLERLIEPFRELIEQTYRLLVTAESFPEFLVVVLAVAAVPALVEELLFRGLIQGSLAEKSGGLTAAVVTGIVFAVYHLNPFTFVPLAALGIYFGYLVYRTGTLLTAMAAHFVNNFLACLFVYTGMNDDMVLLSPTGTPSGELMIVNTAVFLILFLISLGMLNRLTLREPAGEVAAGE